MNSYVSLRAGDILTACDNELNVPSGYLGHSAMAIHDNVLIESVMLFPHIQLCSIDDFVRVHPKHAIYRPISPQLGEAAARYALWYMQAYQSNLQQGYNIPSFSFSPQFPLDDPWASIYCSKLIWLSYYYGAGYFLPNDHFLFSPEDLDTLLKRDPNFILLYKHPEFEFLVDT
jgi:hypothetical protein